ncbi:hypothetical protein [Streptomyces boncukensis]|uniref:Uncharacterized protein n=1 Tax=Streptomyces boncukensis TaxID=2711219 RepID=A0A6G4X602_9ACTN|nr:hypothetical protein [Streptomyces boncukensis]
MAELGVSLVGGAGQVVAEAARGAHRVAVLIQQPGGQVVGVGVHADHALGPQGVERDHGKVLARPRGVQVPAPAGHVVMDAVGHGPVAGDAVAPLGAPVREGDAGCEDVPAMPGVRVPGERCGQLDADLTVGGDADGLVPVAFAGLAVGGEEPAGRLPLRTPLLGRLVGSGQVVPLVQQTPAAAYDTDPPGFPLGADLLVAFFEDRQTPGLGKPLEAGAVAAGLPPDALGPDRQRQPVPQSADPRIE